MGNIIEKFWHNFKGQPDVWFFYSFLITFTLSIRKVLFFYPIGDQFNEYSGIYLYLSDISLVLTIILWVIFILQNKSDTLSRYKIFLAQNKFLIIIPLILVLWSFISITWSDNNNIALFRSLKLLEFYLLYIYIAFNVPRLSRETRMFHPSRNVPRGTSYGAGVEHSIFHWHGTILRNIFRIILFFGLFQAIIGIWQFIIQKSVSFFWLKESLISPEILGVAKTILGGEKFIRSYGLFPHPNILGGFLLFSIISTFLYFKLLKIPPNPPFKKGDALNVPHGTFQLLSPFYKGRVGEGFLWITLAIQFIALLLTFSKSAILGLVIALIFIHYKKMFHPSTNVPRGTWYGASMEHKKKIAPIVAILALLVIIIKPDINSLLFKSLDERALYANVSRGTISAHPLIGIGSGQFVLNMNKFVPRLPTGQAGGTNLELWQYQPAHNVLLLIWSELGVIGFGLFSWWIWKLINLGNNVSRLPRRMKLFHPSHNVPCGTSDGTSVEQNINQKDISRLSRETRMFPVEHSIFHWDGTIMLNQQLLRILKGLLLGIIFIMLFDHYFWDIQQGQIIFWLLAGLIVGVANYDNLDINI